MTTKSMKWSGVASLFAAFATSAFGVTPATQTKPPPATRPSIVLQADAAEQHGTLFATTRPGYTGSAYVTGIDDADDHLTWHAQSDRGGIYQMEIRYSVGELKEFDVAVNGIEHTGRFDPTGDAFATAEAGKVELKQGDNLIELRRGWGHYDVDRVEFIPTDLPELKIPPAIPCDPQATPAARQLLRKLIDGYGKTTLSGVINAGDAKTVFKRTGVLPSIMVGDLVDYSPSRVQHGAISESPPERLIADYKAGYLLSIMWHWNAPSHLIDAIYQKDGKTVEAQWFFGFYTRASTFDLASALKNPNGDDYRLLIRDIDAIAVQLKKFSDAGIPILWRPLHEADGGWLWWGAKGPDAFKALWSIMHDRLVNYHKLHNMIWVYTATTRWDWYPPADEFDVIGVDAYPKDPHDPLSGIWDALQAHWGDQKLIALTEYGGVPDLEASARLGVHWAYFASWSGKQGPDNVPREELNRLYHAPGMGSRLPPTTQAAR